METITCGSCRQPKPVEEFSWRNKAKGLRARSCKACTKLWNDALYAKSDKRKAGIAERNRVAIERNQRFIFDYLREHPCAKCGEADPIVLEFHHRDRADKSGDVTTMVRSKVTVERLKAEIEKCEVLCANCHRRETARETGAYRLLAAE